MTIDECVGHNKFELFIKSIVYFVWLWGKSADSFAHVANSRFILSDLLRNLFSNQTEISNLYFIDNQKSTNCMLYTFCALCLCHSFHYKQRLFEQKLNRQSIPLRTNILHEIWKQANKTRWTNASHRGRHAHNVRSYIRSLAHSICIFMHTSLNTEL